MLSPKVHVRLVMIIKVGREVRLDQFIPKMIVNVARTNSWMPFEGHPKGDNI